SSRSSATAPRRSRGRPSIWCSCSPGSTTPSRSSRTPLRRSRGRSRSRTSSTPTGHTTGSRRSSARRSRRGWRCRPSTPRSPTGRSWRRSSGPAGPGFFSRCRSDASVDPALSAILLGFVLGLQDATDPDHLVAVATIITRERRFTDGALVGVLWGAGHMTTLTVVGALIIGLKLTITPAVGSGLELAVAGMLILLGVLRLRDAVRGLAAVPAGHMVADHEHGGGAGVVHSPPHVHGS